MLVPEAWQHSTRAQHETGRPASKRQRTTHRAVARDDAAATCCAEDIVETIRNAVSNARTLPTANETMRIDCILSGLPYRKIIEDVYENCATRIPDVALVTRAYEVLSPPSRPRCCCCR